MTWQKLLTLCRGGMVNVCLHAKLLLTAAHRQFVVISPSERKYGRISICNATNTHRKMAEKVGRLSFWFVSAPLFGTSSYNFIWDGIEFMSF